MAAVLARTSLAKLTSRETAPLLALGIGGVAVIYLLRRVRSLEASLGELSTKVAKAAADAQLAQQVAAAASRAAAADAQWLPATAPLPARVARPMALAREPSYDGSMSSRDSEATAGYKTAEEDTAADDEDEDGEPPSRRTPHRQTTADAAWAEASDQSLGRMALASSMERDGASSPSPEPQATGAAAAGDGRDEVLERADELYKAHQYDEAYDLLSGRAGAQPLWRLARLCKERAEVATAAGSKEAAKEMKHEGLRHAEAALAADPGHFAPHKWCARARDREFLRARHRPPPAAREALTARAPPAPIDGRYGIMLSLSLEFEGTKAQIEKSFVVKEHFERSAALNPGDPTSEHLVGQWCFEVAGLSWTMRKLAAAIFASPPSATYADALRHFEAAERIQPGFYLRNRMMIAKCYANLKDRNAAREWLQRAVEMPVATVDDEVALAAAKTALAAL